MKHRFSIPALSVCFGAVGFLLRLLQNRTGFEPDTGLPIPGSVPAILLPILLMAAAGILYLAVRRVLPKEMPELPFSRQFDLSNRTGLFSALAGGCIMALSGVLEIVDAMGGSAAAVSADGMEIVSVNTGAGGSGLMIGALSVAAGVCLAAAVIACRKTDVPPLILLAVPVCLLARLILVYRLRSATPVLADYYLEILGLMFLILAAYRLSGFAVQAGRPRIFSFYAEVTAVLALSMLADGAAPSALLTLGGALALTAFQQMLRPGGEEASKEE